MITLILDSTYKDLNVGIVKDNKKFFTSYECFQKQSEYMIVELNKLLKKNKIKANEINEVIVTNGPGSYTGIRIALTIAKIYCYTLNIPCYVLSSLKVLQDFNNKSICISNARSNRSYIGVYDKNKCILKDQILTNDEVLKYILKHKNYSVCGDTSCLKIDGRKFSILDNMYNLKDEKFMIKNVFELKAIYMKD